jgi:hypothetical protein
MKITKLKPKVVTPFKPVSLTPAPAHLSDVFEHFLNPDPKKPLYGCTGCKVAENVVLARTYKPDPFRLGLKLEERWYELDKVRGDDPGVMARAMIDYGPSPAEQEAEARRAQAEQDRQAEEEKRLRDRAEHQRRLRSDARYRRDFQLQNGGQ